MPPRGEKLPPIGLPYESFPDHPLFPVDEGEKNPQVTFIQITRIDRGIQYYGPVLRAEELTTTDELFEMYGGGHYELWARGPSKLKADGAGNVTKRRRFMLPGRSKPISKDPTADELRAIDGVRPMDPAPASSSSSAGVLGGGNNDILLAMMQMQQQNAQEFAKMMMLMMTSSKSESTEMAKMQAASQQQFTTLMLTLSGQQQQSMVQMMTALMGGRSSGPEEMAKYAKLMKDLGIGGAAAKGDTEDEEGGIGKMIEDAADAIQGLVLLKGGAKPEGEVVGSGAPAAPGSAAAVADAMLPKA